MTLDTLPLNRDAIITAVGGEGPLRCRLLDMGLIPKTTVRVEKIAPLGDPIELRVRGYALSLRKEDARNIEVEVKEALSLPWPPTRTAEHPPCSTSSPAPTSTWATSPASPWTRSPAPSGDRRAARW